MGPWSEKVKAMNFFPDDFNSCSPIQIYPDSDIKWGLNHLKSPATQLFVQ